MVHPTLLVDEADSFLAGNEELRGIINSGHCRANSTVLRTIELPNGHEVRQFDVWGAVAIAAIGKLPATIEDRSIKAGLYRRRRDEEVKRLRLDRLNEFAPLASRCARWTADHLAQLDRADRWYRVSCMTARQLASAIGDRRSLRRRLAGAGAQRGNSAVGSRFRRCGEPARDAAR
jgi:hypothetical protein